jgi:acyl carrier protein
MTTENGHLLVEDSIRRFIADGARPVPGVEGELPADYPLLDNDVLDSLGIYSLVVYLEGQYAIRIADEELLPQNFENVTAIARLVRSKL